MFNVGDIVLYRFPDADDVLSYGIIEEIKGMVYTIRWFDDGIVNDYPSYDFKIYQRA